MPRSDERRSGHAWLDYDERRALAPLDHRRRLRASRLRALPRLPRRRPRPRDLSRVRLATGTPGNLIRGLFFDVTIGREACPALDVAARTHKGARTTTPNLSAKGVADGSPSG